MFYRDIPNMNSLDIQDIPKHSFEHLNWNIQAKCQIFCVTLPTYTLLHHISLYPFYHSAVCSNCLIWPFQISSTSSFLISSIIPEAVLGQDIQLSLPFLSLMYFGCTDASVHQQFLQIKNPHHCCFVMWQYSVVTHVHRRRIHSVTGTRGWVDGAGDVQRSHPPGPWTIGGGQVAAPLKQQLYSLIDSIRWQHKASFTPLEKSWAKQFHCTIVTADGILILNFSFWR